jgi:hypothetical protein
LFALLNYPGKLFSPEDSAVLKTMRDLRGAKTAVTSAGADGHLPRFKQDNVTARVGLLGLQCRPQTGKSPADNGEVGLDLGCKRWGFFWSAGIIQPEGGQFHIRNRL